MSSINHNTIVLKLGGSVLASDAALPAAVSEVYRSLREGKRVVAVVSAVGETTDSLLARARAVNDNPDDATLSALLATGEHTAAALLTLALRRAGIDATSRTVEQIGLIASGPRLDADPLALDTWALRDALKKAAVVVVPGYLARLADGTPATLGRGGSDLTALFIASRLGSPLVLLKDVPGLFEWDPAIPGRRPRLFASITLDDALKLDGRIVQHKALRFAQRERLAFTVRTLNRINGTRVGADRTALASDPLPAAPLRVGLIGLGTVGRGVAERLRLSPAVAQVVAVAVREPARHLATVPSGGGAVQITGDALALASRTDIDLLIDCCSDQQVALASARAALARGGAVVTASKTLAGPHGSDLLLLAAESNGSLAWSGACGGGVPVIETVRTLRATGEKPVSLRAVLNGTCNFVLDRLAEGQPLYDAVRRAQQRGLAEPDPSDDLDGTDAARKLIVLARELFDVELILEQIDRIGIENLTPGTLQNAGARGKVVRLVAELEQTRAGLKATVAPRELSPADPLATARDEENVFVISTEKGLEPTILRGLGAGRWPTTEAVVGDVLALARDRTSGHALHREDVRKAVLHEPTPQTVTAN